jgi:hypothetical protein
MPGVRRAEGEHAKAKLTIELGGKHRFPQGGTLMTTGTVAHMSQTEFRKMLEEVVEETVEQKLLELLGDPDEGLNIRETVQVRLLRQREEVATSQHGQSFEGVVKELGLE